MANQDDRVPGEVEEYLISVIARAGGPPAGQLGGAVAARRMKTVVVERRLQSSTEGDVAAAIRQTYADAIALESGGDIQRFAIPLGRTGLNHVVVDILDG